MLHLEAGVCNILPLLPPHQGENVKVRNPQHMLLSCQQEMTAGLKTVKCAEHEEKNIEVFAQYINII